MIKSTPHISVIVPVYNTSKYLSKCLKSILTQSITNIEIIVVNDGSTDNSLKIIKNFLVEDNRIKVISKQNNEGLELARKIGVSFANGMYIYHVDSDDWLVPETLELLYNEAILYNADIVVGNFFRVLDGFGILKRKSKVGIFQKLLISKTEFETDYYKNFFGINLFPVSMCGKLYRKELLDRSNINLLGFNLGEDLNYNLQIFPKAEKILFLPQVVYNYRFGGMTSKFNSHLMPAALRMYDIKKYYIKKYNRFELNRYIVVELKNYLKTFIEMLIRFNRNDKFTNDNVICQLLNNEQFKEVIKFYSEKNTSNDIFVQAMVQMNVKKLINISKDNIKKNFLSYKVKRFVSVILLN